MKLLFRHVGADEVEQEMTQRDQFNTDEVGLTETLIREAHQNSLDARANSGAGPVRTRLALIEASPDRAAYWRSLLAPLAPHLNACGIDTSGFDFGLPRLLVVEDFGTVGLTGAFDAKDTGHFSDFWRRVGRSHKGGTQGGRWGLGKLVFSSSSKLHTLFGVTIRHDDKTRTPLLMGQAVLTNHKIDNKNYAPHGFFADARLDGFQLPIMDPERIQKFQNAAGLSRKGEPGLSIVIPFISEDLKLADFIPIIVRNYFFPILTGQLEVEVGAEKITGATFDALARKYGGPTLADGQLTRFIRDIEVARSGKPTVTLLPNWSQNMERALDEEALKTLRESYGGRKLVHVRVPVALKRKAGPEEISFFDLFLRSADDGIRGQALFIRSAITLPGEAQFFRAGQAFGALVASDGPVTAFLGDAENPAHTRWNGNAEKLTNNWKNPSARLREIRGSLNALHDLIARAIEKLENDALIHLLSIKEAGVERKISKSDPVIKPPVVPPLTPKPRLYTIVPRHGGFAIKGDSGAAEAGFPLQIKVSAAYDLMRGNPLTKHSPLDFDFTKGEIIISKTGAECTPIAANELLIDAADRTFLVEVTGFDANRDLLVRTVV